jgi:hypothetical protein
MVAGLKFWVDESERETENERIGGSGRWSGCVLRERRGRERGRILGEGEIERE